MIVTATYRLQLHRGFGFRAAAAIAGYLDALGVSHAYASPYLTAVSGSAHGYDLVDPGAISPELGGEPEYVAWTDALAARGLGHVVDVVPNHMAASTENAWWSDVLENGPSSLHADHFDIEWHPPKAALENKVLLPVLGAQYGDVLERGELVLERRGGAFCVRHFDRCLPVNPSSVVGILERAAATLDLRTEEPRRQELESIATGLRNLPAPTETAHERRAERAREKEVLKRRLAALTGDAAIAAAIDREVLALAGSPSDPASWEALDRLLLEQNYRLAYWRVATEEINYRRFFDINDLAAVRMESEAVFEDSHRLLLRYVEEGRLQGLRLDHTDGLYDPAEYFAKLRRRTVGRDLYVVAEKILEADEELPPGWAIDGTTGYDFLVQLYGLFVDRSAEAPLTRLYQDVTGDGRTFAAHAHDGKRAIMRASLSSEVHMLAIRLERIAMRDRRSRDFTLAMLRRAVGETLAAFPVYRTYIRPDGSREPSDEAIVRRAIRLARRRNPEVSPSAFDFLSDVLLLRAPALGEEDHAARVELAMRFQQLTGPVMAKGVEDTAFYTYLRFAAANEVGGDPGVFGTSVGAFHAASQARHARWPRAMLATSTHDTKRGEDVRARLAILTEMPERWEAMVRRWLARAERHATTIDDEPAPGPGDRYLFVQTAFGALPLDPRERAAFPERLAAYAVKAAREAKQRTSWLSPDDAYEAALRAYVLGAMADPELAGDLAAEVDRIATHGASNALAARVLQLASPGVADTYQGSELWDFRLVDPDNRGPVDYELRRALLASIEGARAADLLASFRDGRIKLHVVRAGLALRRAHPDLLLEGSYEPIPIEGEAIACFAREKGERRLVCAAVVKPLRATSGGAPWATGDVWGGARVPIPEGRYRDVLDERTVEVPRGGVAAAVLFATLPAALLLRT